MEAACEEKQREMVEIERSTKQHRKLEYYSNIANVEKEEETVVDLKQRAWKKQRRSPAAPIVREVFTTTRNTPQLLPFGPSKISRQLGRVCLLMFRSFRQRDSSGGVVDHCLRGFQFLIAIQHQWLQ